MWSLGLKTFDGRGGANEAALTCDRSFNTLRKACRRSIKARPTSNIDPGGLVWALEASGCNRANVVHKPRLLKTSLGPPVDSQPPQIDNLLLQLEETPGSILAPAKILSTVVWMLGLVP
jgi:hypothetical protein